MSPDALPSNLEAASDGTAARVGAIHTIGTLHLRHGGPSRSVAALCEALCRRGVPVDLLALREGEPSEWVAVSKLARVQTVEGRNSLLGLLEGEKRFRGAIIAASKAIPCEELVLHDHGMWLPTNHAAAVCARRLGVPRMVSPRGMMSRWALDHRRWKKRLAWAAFQRRDLHSADVIHATSQLEADEARALGLRQAIAVVPNGVIVPELVPPSRPLLPRRALFLSRIHPKKGLLNLITAWARLRPSGWCLTIAGNDDEGHQAQVEALILSEDLRGSVEIIGPVSDAAKWTIYRSADLFILPTFSENFGMVVAEALAAGIPVITTRGAPWSALEQERCGWWIDIGVEPLIEAIRQATQMSGQELAAHGARGRAYVLRELSWESVAIRMVAVYRWMLGVQGCPADVRLD